MEAQLFPDKIAILGAHLPNDKWESLLDELKAEHIPSWTPVGKRMAVVLAPNMRVDAIIYRTTAMPDETVLGILKKYGISRFNPSAS
jgi:hypothetical protein